MISFILWTIDLQTIIDLLRPSGVPVKNPFCARFLPSVDFPGTGAGRNAQSAGPYIRNWNGSPCALSFLTPPLLRGLRAHLNRYTIVPVSPEWSCQRIDCLS